MGLVTSGVPGENTARSYPESIVHSQENVSWVFMGKEGRDLPQPRTCICIFSRLPGPVAGTPFLWEPHAGWPAHPATARCSCSRYLQPCTGVSGGFFLCLAAPLPARSQQERACPGVVTPGAAALGCRGAHCGDAKPWCGQPWELPPEPLPAPPVCLAEALGTDGCRLCPVFWTVATQLESAAPFPWGQWKETPPLLALPGSGSPRAVLGCAGRKLGGSWVSFTSPHLGRGCREAPHKAALVI